MDEKRTDRRNGKDGSGRRGPADGRDTGTTGSTDERSSENREKGLEKDRERARTPDDVAREDTA